MIIQFFYFLKSGSNSIEINRIIEIEEKNK
jgi:hypothetical protein